MRDPALSGRSKEAQRDALVERLRLLATSIAGRGGRVTVVFDAHSSLGTSSATVGRVTTVFANSADDEIVRRCEAVRGQVVVYTDDIRLRMRISQDVGRHVEYRDVSLLEARADKARPASSGRTPGGDKALPEGTKKEITAELEGLWLPDDEE